MPMLSLLFLLAVRQSDAPLPAGVRAEWGLALAWREATPTRERVCLNGLWRWQPGTGDALPDGGWGWFKVPGCWPGINDYMQKDCQTVIANPSWVSKNFGGLTTAWYQREFTIPAGWNGRKIALTANYVNSLATVFLDGKQAGNISFPAGQLDITGKVKPGSTYRLSIQLVALPLKAAMLSYSDTNAAKLMKATVERRGLCGDVYLVSSPAKARIEEVCVDTSVRNGSLTVRAQTHGLDPMKKYRFNAQILDRGTVVQTLASDPFAGADAVAFTRPWLPKKLWDINTPQNQYDLKLTLLDSSRKVLDVQAPKRFGFRELWISGRDFMLNGTRIFWSCVPLENAGISAGMSNYEGAKETLRRLKEIGVNMVYTHNYDCNPGSYLSFEEILRAADDVGVLVALTQPHFGNYDWSSPDADQNNGYARHAAFFARVAGNHPSVIAYATSHNATGYNEDTNPDMIDGINADRDSWAGNNVKKALRAQAIIERLDPSRIVYHHSSGNLGTMHTMNFYLNFVPMQEMDDWYEHWATVGVKPAFMVEYGVPFSWDWSLYRGWYKGERSFGNAQVPWEYTMAEWNAQFLGDRAYNVSETEKRNVRWEANKFKTSQVWFRWDYPSPMGSVNPDFADQQEVWARYTADNWRAFRTWGVSGISPWETRGTFWQLKDSVKRGRVDLKTDWDHLQRPGYSPDYIDGRYENRDTAYDVSDWEPTAGGKSLLANNGPLLAYIGGKPEAFTDKEHNFRAGDSFEKQLILVNNSRETVTCRCAWSIDLPTIKLHDAETSLSLAPRRFPSGEKREWSQLANSGDMTTSRIPTGEIQKFPIKFKLPAGLKPGKYRIHASVEFIGHGTQADEFTINVLPAAPRVAPLGNVGIFDPKGETTKLLSTFGINGTVVSAGSDLSEFHTLIIGKGAMTPDGPGFDLSRVRAGLKVLMFEQTSEALEQRFGFRVEEYGLRNVFTRLPGHPILSGLDEELMRDWHGSATILPARGKFDLSEKFNGVSKIVRNGMVEPRVWRCGNRGNVASVIIEKPAAGDFMPILDGGYSLQYTPLMEYREGKGMIVFCQMDVTGRTDSDPAAQLLVSNLLNYVSYWQPVTERKIVYAGEAAGKRHLESAGFDVTDFSGTVTGNSVLVIGPGGDADVAAKSRQVADWLTTEGRVLAIGLDQEAFNRSLPVRTTTTMQEYIDSSFIPGLPQSALAGIGPADVYNRDPRKIPVLTPGVSVLGETQDRHVAQFQLVPWTFDTAKLNTKRVFRHTSVVLSRLLGNLGVHGSTPLLARFGSPVKAGEQRWLKGFYLDTPVLEDDPYRFFGW